MLNSIFGAGLILAQLITPQGTVQAPNGQQFDPQTGTLICQPAEPFALAVASNAPFPVTVVPLTVDETRAFIGQVEYFSGIDVPAEVVQLILLISTDNPETSVLNIIVDANGCLLGTNEIDRPFFNDIMQALNNNAI